MSVRTQASPEEVYEVLADPHTHIEWAGTRQPKGFRLLTLEAPRGAAQVGTVFTSTGTQPMSADCWEDRSTVTVADRPRTFEFETEGRLGRRHPMTGRYRHRYEILPDATGSRVTYNLNQLTVAMPTLRYRLPVVRELGWRMVFPKLAGRGLRNLIALVDERAARTRQTPPPIRVDAETLPAAEA